MQKRQKRRSEVQNGYNGSFSFRLSCETVIFLLQKARRKSDVLVSMNFGSVSHAVDNLAALLGMLSPTENGEDTLTFPKKLFVANTAEE